MSTHNHHIDLSSPDSMEVLATPLPSTEVLGHGGQGTVHRSPDGTMAIKRFRKEKYALREIKIYNKLQGLVGSDRHPHVLWALGHKMCEGKTQLYLELATGPELFEYVKQRRALDDAEVWYWAVQMLAALTHLHRNRIMHGDVKLDNFMLDADLTTLKIMDFGFAKVLPSDCNDCTSGAGTPCWSAPEVIATAEKMYPGEPYDGCLADVWSYGICVYAMRCGITPYLHKEHLALYRKVREGGPAPLLGFPPTCVPDAQLAKMICTCLSIDPLRRAPPEVLWRLYYQ